MDNSTQDTSSSLNNPGFMAYCILLVVTVLVAAVMITFNVLALLMATSIPRPVRLFLVNLLLAGLQVAAVVVSVASISAVRVGVGTHLHLRTNRAIIIQPRHTCSYAASTAASIASVYLFRQRLLLRLVHSNSL